MKLFVFYPRTADGIITRPFYATHPTKTSFSDEEWEAIEEKASRLYLMIESLISNSGGQTGGLHEGRESLRHVLEEEGFSILNGTDEIEKYIEEYTFSAPRVTTE